MAETVRTTHKRDLQVRRKGKGVAVVQLDLSDF